MAQLPPLAVSAAYQLGFRRTQSLSAAQHLAVLGYLCDELLDTHAVRDTLQSALQALPAPSCQPLKMARFLMCKLCGVKLCMGTIHGVSISTVSTIARYAVLRVLLVAVCETTSMPGGVAFR